MLIVGNHHLLADAGGTIQKVVRFFATYDFKEIVE